MNVEWGIHPNIYLEGLNKLWKWQTFQSRQIPRMFTLINSLTHLCGFFPTFFDCRFIDRLFIGQWFYNVISYRKIRKVMKSFPLAGCLRCVYYLMLEHIENATSHPHSLGYSLLQLCARQTHDSDLSYFIQFPSKNETNDNHAGITIF